MVHNLATANGKTSFFDYGEAPRHGLGQRLDAPATAQEAITAEGLDYEVRLTPIATYDGLTVGGRKTVVRYDRQEVVGVVSHRYVPVQNGQAFGFFDAVVTDDCTPLEVLPRQHRTSQRFLGLIDKQAINCRFALTFVRDFYAGVISAHSAR